MATGKISKKQQEILDYLKEQILDRGYPPTVREICDAVCLKSTSSVHSHLKSLEKNGYIKRDPTKPRAIEITDDSFQSARRDFADIPLVGQVAAGLPILATENIERYFPIPADYLPDNPAFMLRVKGNSMVNMGINNGDFILVEEGKTAENGDVVVVLVEDSATVKRFYKEKGYYRLQPENDQMDPIIVRGDLHIVGKVFGVLRFMNH